ncbi:hypothetical protein QFC21_000112 [Naganishia friedmannii]|uniref:Uncharacterized protein n=1 Tax=Naganishia friedmannii TaxID=89922 RepID=A0ACC2WCJ3_9TREE|nr:hypothetical protein QFC21_000112 [Naganishia friedmannii]
MLTVASSTVKASTTLTSSFTVSSSAISSSSKASSSSTISSTSVSSSSPPVNSLLDGQSPVVSSSSKASSSPVASSGLVTSSVASSPTASSSIATFSSSSAALASSSKPASSTSTPPSSAPSVIASSSIATTVSISNSPSSSAILTSLLIPSQISSVVSSVVSSAIPTPSSKWTSPTLPSGWVAVPGCIAEGSAGRALTGSTYSSASLTPEVCIAYCNSNGYSLAGVEYGSECYCGNEYANGAAPSILSTACEMPCSGDPKKLCAGPSAMNIFRNSLYVAPKLNLPAGWAPSDPLCIAEVPGRALSGSFWAADNMTVDACVAYCSGMGFPLAAVEYGRECMCGTKLVNGASFDKPSTGCSMPCAGSTASSRQICGGNNALSVYFNSGYVSKLVLPTGWQSLGCIAEGTQGRALISAQWESDSMTIEACLTYCSTRGYGMAGLNPSIAKAVNQVTSAVGTWKSSGLCLQEVQGRALRGAAVSSPGMNVEYCLNYCGGLGYILAGVEYDHSWGTGNECYCGQKLEGGASVSLQSGECRMPCVGNTEQICGGPNGLNFYTTDAINVTVTLPTGWSKVGCVAEPIGHRALNVSAFDVSPIQGSFMTGVACAKCGQRQQL